MYYSVLNNFCMVFYWLGWFMLSYAHAWDMAGLKVPCRVRMSHLILLLLGLMSMVYFHLLFYMETKSNIFADIPLQWWEGLIVIFIVILVVASFIFSAWYSGRWIADYLIRKGYRYD